MADKPVERQRLYNAIIKEYADGKEMTARECAVRLHSKGIVPYPTRGTVQPRLTEMCKFGWFITIGSKFDRATKKTVTIYKLSDGKVG